MFVQSEKFIEAHAGKLADISIYHEESNYPTWRLASPSGASKATSARVRVQRRTVGLFSRRQDG